MRVDSGPTPRRRRPTMSDVAREAGISRGTVSRFVTGTSYVSQDARKAIEEAIARVGYVPSAAARSLAGSRTQNVALIVHEQASLFADDPNLAGMMIGANRSLTEHQHQLIVLLADDGASMARLENTLSGGLIDGVMLASARVDDPLLSIVTSSGIPAAIVGRPLHADAIPAVDVDNRGGASVIVQRLVATGRRRVAMLAGPADMRAALDRVTGYTEAVGDLYDPALIVHTRDWSYAAGQQAMSTLLAEHPDIDGVFGASDAIAAGALDVLLDSGRSVPNNVGVVGFDNTRWAEISRPALSTVAQPAEALGERMAEFVIRQLNGESLAGTLALESTHVVWRDSA